MIFLSNMSMKELRNVSKSEDDFMFERRVPEKIAEFIEENHETLDDDEIGEKLGLKSTTIAFYRSCLGITRKNHRYPPNRMDTRALNFIKNAQRKFQNK